MKIRTALAAILATCFIAPAAQAVALTKSFTLTTSVGSGAPVDPVVLSFTVTYDSLSTVAGLTVDSFNLDAPVRYAYDADSDGLRIGTNLIEGGGCYVSSGEDAFCTYVSELSTGSPGLTFFWFAMAETSEVYSPDATIVENVAAPVPEPATWGMMLLGFGLVGVAARRRRTTLAI